MKIVSSALAPLKIEAEKTVNDHFKWLATQDQWRSLAHSLKRIEALSVLDGRAASSAFAQAAVVEGYSDLLEFAQFIVSKGDAVMRAETDRRKLILAVRDATSGPALTEILKTLPHG
jgi:hypothetical protein